MLKLIFFTTIFVSISSFSNELQMKNKDNFFLPYKRNFIVFGDKNSKLQFSFKVKMFKKSQFFFGYTQKAIWDIFDNSAPFRDTTFNPEIFYRLNFSLLNYTHLDLGMYEHSSNGKEGSESRSYDKSFIRLSSQKIFSDSVYFVMENKLQFLYREDETNQDISDYQGFYQLTLRLGEIFKFALEKEEVYIHYVPGKDIFDLSNKDQGSVNIGFSFKFSNSTVLPKFYLDYFSGYGESLLEYDKKQKSIRFGIIKHW